MRRRSRGLRFPHLPGKPSARRRRELALVFALIFGAGAGASRLAATPVPFAVQPISNDADFAAFVHAADIDGDGDLDGLSASIEDDSITWYENASANGDGSSWVPSTISSVANGANSVFAADIDGDGDLDVLSTAVVGDEITWYQNAGGGTGWAATTICDNPLGGACVSSLADGPTSVVAADINGDGDTDVVATANNGDEILWFENMNGLGTAWTQRTIASGTTVDGVIRVVAADVDGDGDVDVASASFQADRIAWHQNNGSGTAWTLRDVFTDAANQRAVHAADFDGDGDVDLLSGSVAVADDALRWHENLNGVGTSWSTATITTLADQPSGVFAADVDGDGDLDALSASRADDEVAWFENTAGDGSAWTRRLITSVADRAYSVFAGDVDGDGDVDVLSASAYDDEIAWFENLTIHRSALLEERQIVTAVGAYGARSVFAADIDGDGHTDVLSASTQNDRVAWYENVPGDGSSWTLRTITTTADGAVSVHTADVDGDGDADVLAAAAFADTVTWHENELGNGTSWTARTIASGVGSAYSVFAADIDGDGDLDVLAAAAEDDQAVWYRNPSNDAASWTPHTVAGADGATSVHAADVDSDGDVDVLVAAFEDDSVVWHENVGGTGLTWASDTITATATGARSVFAADVDGDGDLDVLAASSDDDRVRWFENDGGGDGWTPRTIATTAVNPRSVFATDFDADGDVDVLSASLGDDEVAWYENANGIGTSWSLHTITNAAEDAFAVHAADIDGDGDVDALSASFGDDTIAWYPNRGGQFALPTTALAQGVLANSQEEVALQIDLEHRGRSGDSDVELDALEIHFANSVGANLTSAQANNLIAKLELFLDDGSGSFALPGDTLLESIDTLVLSSGVLSVELAGGGPSVEVAVGETKRYFVVVTLTSNASTQIPNELEITHLTEASSSARDESAPAVALRLEHHPDTSTGLLDTDLTTASCKSPFELDLLGFQVTSAVVCEAGTVLTAGNGLTVTATGDLTLRAGQRVRFATDFSVKPGGGLHADVDPSLEP